MVKQQRSAKPDYDRDNLFAPAPGAGSSTGEFGQDSQSVSLYTRLFGLHPNLERLAAGAMLVGGAAIVRRIGH